MFTKRSIIYNTGFLATAKTVQIMFSDICGNYMPFAIQETKWSLLSGYFVPFLSEGKNDGMNKLMHPYEERFS